MYWTRKSGQRQHYCAVHNVDCQLHSHPGDPWVLDVSPNLVPGAWICPEAVDEIAEFVDEAIDKMKDNDPEDPYGFYINKLSEEIIAEAARLAGDDEMFEKINHRGMEELSHDELLYATYLIEQHQDELPDEAEDIVEQIMVAVDEVSC